MLKDIAPYLFLGFLFLLPSCATHIVEVQASYWLPDLSLDGKVEENNIGQDIDFVDDLGVDDENFPGGRVILNMTDSSFLRLEYTPIDTDSDEILTKSVTFNGKVYNVGTRVLTDFEMRYARFGWGWYIIDFDMVRVGTLLEAKLFDLEMSLDAPAVPLNESEDFTFGLPTVGVIAEVNPIDMLSIYGEVSGIAAGGYGHMLDGEVGVKLIPIDYFTVSAGYRVFNIDLDVDDNEADLMLNGPFISGSFRF